MAKGTYNSRLYGHLVKPVVDNKEDFAWVCNKLAKLYQKIDDGCVDNCRVDIALKGGGKTKDYIKTMKGGCCGTVDKMITNERTGNSFWIGFNYGH